VSRKKGLCDRKGELIEISRGKAIQLITERAWQVINIKGPVSVCSSSIDYLLFHLVKF
jgi:hypothetical protein